MHAVSGVQCQAWVHTALLRVLSLWQPNPWSGPGWEPCLVSTRPVPKVLTWARCHLACCTAYTAACDRGSHCSGPFPFRQYLTAKSPGFAPLECNGYCQLRCMLCPLPKAGPVPSGKSEPARASTRWPCVVLSHQLTPKPHPPHCCCCRCAVQWSAIRT